MTKLFISHSSRDDAFVRDLRAALSYHEQEGWIDSRELRGGDPLLTEIQKAIEEASAYAVVVSTDSLQSTWVGKELKYALKIQEQRGKDKFPVIPLSLNGTKLGVMEGYFDEEPIYLSVSSEAGGVEAAVNSMLVALGKRKAADLPLTVQPKAEPLEELVLELTDLKILEQEGVRRASARARLVYEPAMAGQPEVASEQSWRLTAPIGPIEGEELRWYLEKYSIWPSKHFRKRAQKVEKNLVKWGQLLHKAAMPVEYTANVINAWAKIADDADRRFSVHVDPALEAGASEGDVKTAREAATLLLALPWELLHDSEGYSFQGAKPVRVRRRLPNTKVLDVPVVATPIRILLVIARPEDDSCGYIDHRASALPLVEAMESLPGLVKINILSPPTLPALRAALDRARSEKKPYHVVHFDGHGVFDPEVGLGGLCFENPEDRVKLENRRHTTVFTSELGPLLRDYRIPLVFLEACETALAEKASDSVASELLKAGVASVVAMSHKVLVETSRRFVQVFYKALADGHRMGDAMLAGQRELKDNTFRGAIFGAGELQLEDWFVPVLYQEKDDPQLFKITPAKQTVEDFQAALSVRLGDLPPTPETGFIGRSRELLGLQRLLREQTYAVVRGQGGEGKTALAAEFARWMVRSHQFHRAAFVSVETNGNERAVVDALGKQLIHKNFSAAGDPEEAILEVERALREQPALLVLDNMESVLLPPFIEEETPAALSHEAAEELKAILALCERLLKAGETRVVFTSREALPAPFDAARHRRELQQLDREDAVKLVERVLNATGKNAGNSSDAAREEIEQLVDAVHCHARTLALLAPSLRERGVEATCKSLVDLMAEMDKSFPGSREKSVFASVELSLGRLSAANRDRVGVLGVFHGALDLDVLGDMTQWDEADVESLAHELVETGLATEDPYNHLTLNPALCPYLRGRLDPQQRESLTASWVENMHGYLQSLWDTQSSNPQIVASLTALELPNLFALLELTQREADAELTINVATSLHRLLEDSGKPRLLARVAEARDAATTALGDTWSHAQFKAIENRIDQHHDAGKVQEALEGARQLLDRARLQGKTAYDVADYDIATATFLLARMLHSAGESEEALPVLDEARKLFKPLAKAHPDSAEQDVSACYAEQGDCLVALGRLGEAAKAYQTAIRRAEKVGDKLNVAGGKTQLASVRLKQGQYEEALAAYTEAQEWYTELDEKGSVAMTWHQAGIVYENAGDLEAAEDAYRESLTISVQLGDVAAQGNTLNQLGNLYDTLGRFEEAIVFYQQAVDTAVELGDISAEGSRRSNLASTLLMLKRFDEAREQIYRAVECDSRFGLACEPWKTWDVAGRIETDAGNPAAAAKAKRKAFESFLDYRRAGGENHEGVGRTSLSVTESLLAGDNSAAASLIKELAADPEATGSIAAFLRTLQSIVTGSRDRSLADAPDLNYQMAAEILFLIETLEKAEPSSLP